jgi:hypothetical protein
MLRSILFVGAILTAAVAHAADAAPKVVFIGDNFTFEWASAFAANPNWINKGTEITEYPQEADASALAADFSHNVVALHPAVVHIMLGIGDAADDHNVSQSVNGKVLSALQSMLQQAKAANIQVVLGLEPLLATNNSKVLQMLNAIIATFGEEHNIPVINYGDALNSLVGSTANFNGGYASTLGGNSTAAIVWSYSTPQYLQPDPLFNLGLIPTVDGFSLMTEMAEASINTLHAKLLGGYLTNSQKISLPNSVVVYLNVKTVAPTANVQFIPYGIFSNGRTEPLINTNYAGTNGTWASSNPLVLYVNQQGLAWGISTGTAHLTYTSPTGVRFAEWTIHVTTPTS